ncbi:hypothetical protein P7K49_039582 [Saguinus oedipus]|uniref:Uncharacterized protein n=1 Tax=Saguinus oedipus TaxID=9490 RepID=A0ABQ9T9W0_SAGOE|nr:hypothetical protein P7K49_039582 [Saguinus oedipus]
MGCDPRGWCQQNIPLLCELTAPLRYGPPTKGPCFGLQVQGPLLLTIPASGKAGGTWNWPLMGADQLERASQKLFGAIPIPRQMSWHAAEYPQEIQAQNAKGA